ncbi:LuxR C-terminal-related transcriptional regulator [Cellulomonas sp.]|uniref:LuxR C-terminal-related transcriptional regulator n=1 Tax=Cellulomonas sp. TaxID=40001 RepID=UPI00281252CA|nr:LuxR C-terminal-related transcriptional regulator [Cellulomonas sp.]
MSTTAEGPPSAPPVAPAPAGPSPAGPATRVGAPRLPVTGPAAVLPEQRGPRRSTTVLHPEVVAHVADTLAEGRGVLVVGDAGTGKTAAVTQALAALRARLEVRVVTISGASARDGLPLAPLEPLLHDGAASFGSFAGTLRAVSDGLARRGDGRTLVLRVEDAHLLDDGSARALDWLVRQDDVLVVATVRRSWSARAPWAALWRDDTVERVDLPALTWEGAERWLTDELGGPVTVDTVHRLWSMCGGNVFHLRESVLEARTAGTLARRAGVWVWHGRARTGSRLLELAEQDVSRLGEPARAALEVCAVAGPVPLDTLLDLVPDAAVEALTLAGAVTVTTAATPSGGATRVVDVAHASYADAVRARTPVSRQRALLERALAAPVLPGVAPASLVRSVTLALGLGLDVPMARVREAAAAAFPVSLTDAVVGLADGALAGAGRSVLERVELHVLRAEGAQHEGDHAGADRDLLRAHALLAGLDAADPAVLALLLQVAERRALVAQYHRGDVDEAVRLLAAAAAAGDVARPGAADPWWRAEADVARLVRLAWAGRFPEVLDAAVARLDGGTHPARRVALVPPTAIGLADRGEVARAAALCRRYGDVASAHDGEHRWGRGEVLVATFLVLLWLGDVPAVHAAAAPNPTGAPYALDWATTHAARGLAGIADGSWTAARAQLASANARFAVSDVVGIARYTLVAEAVAAAACGDAAAARDLLQRSAQAPVASSAAVEGDLRVRRLDALAWLRDRSLREEALATARWARERGAARIELEALHRVLDAARRDGLPAEERLLERVRALRTVCEGPRAAALVGHAAAVATGDADVVRIAERELNRCGLWLPPVGPPTTLTAREREIASLAAGGMTSRAIAHRLTLSTRTVDSHLSRVFGKLGVHSREELATLLR